MSMRRDSIEDGLFPGKAPALLSTGPLRLVRVVVERGIERGKTSRIGAGVGVGSGVGEEGLTYRCDDSDIRVGERVSVPLGRGDTRAGGVVVAVGGVELAGTIPLARIKPIFDRAGAHLSEPLLELARWMSGYYVAPLGMVLSVMLPAAVKRGTGGRTRVLLEPTGIKDEQLTAALAGLTRQARAAWELTGAIATEAWPLEPRDLAARLECRTIGPVNKLVAAGLLRGVPTRVVCARRQMLPSSHVGGGDAHGLELTGEQGAALAGCAAGLGSFGVHLLRGITGSGKTEVYLRLIERVLAEDAAAGAIVLVPEIALTPQTSQRFRNRFERYGVVTLHSGLSEAERNREWAAISAGSARVVVGARSAIFAPFAKVGLIVVDEEHDGSYKQDQIPRYHARDVAIKRGQIENCPVILGSATPSLESWCNAQGGGKFKLWTLSSRPGGGELPKVEIVDLAEEAKLDRALAAGAMLGPRLSGAIATTLRENGQIILLHNRRGYASVVGCPDRTCGWVLHCASCSAAMVFHKDAALRRGGVVRCHHCLAEQVRPETCPLCKKRARSFGAGTQRVEEELASKFGALGLVQDETFLRVDSDTMRSAPDYFAALSRFARGELKLLVGTQMIAKGLDFPNVRLVGVVNADTGLMMADFRAAERTFQLVSQVAGRAGRADARGRVIVQTYSPEAECLRLAARHDFVGFATGELRIRKAAGLPPLWRMARIVCRDKDAAKAERAANELRAALDAAADAGGTLEINGPMPCVIERVSDHWRFELKLLAPGAGELQRLLQKVRGMGLLTSDAHTAVDVDPVSLM